MLLGSLAPHRAATQGFVAGGEEIDHEIRAAAALRYDDPAGSLATLEALYHRTLAERDTVRAVAVLMEQATTNGHQANYKDSYDKLWRALLLAEAAQLPASRAAALTELGRYFSFYHRWERAFDYYTRALNITKELVRNGRAQRGRLTDAYHPFVTTYRALNDTAQLRRYLDSAALYYNPAITFVERPRLDFERAFLLSQTGRAAAAIALYESTLPWFAEHDPGYRTLVYTYLGDAYRRTGDYPAAEASYRRAEDVSRRTNSHLDFSPIIHRQLATLYAERGDYRNAHTSLERFVALDDRYFDSRSQVNRPLLEIQDDYRRAQEDRADEAREQRLAALERERQLSYYKLGALAVVLFFLLLSGLLLFKYLRSRHRAEKTLLRRERELELRKANEIVDLKNKELAASTLKLIAKDEFIADIQDRLAKLREQPGGETREVGAILRNIRNNSNNDENWQAFEARFVAVNKDFYRTLRERYPKLTQGDLKLCALIKLNFSSKDVAKLMGISVESVHTTRYRLRKKLGLERKDNLAEFIANVV